MGAPAFPASTAASPSSPAPRACSAGRSHAPAAELGGVALEADVLDEQALDAAGERSFFELGTLLPTRVVGYGAAKAAVENLTRWPAVELAPRVRVNAIAPGFFLGEQNRALLLDPDG